MDPLSRRKRWNHREAEWEAGEPSEGARGLRVHPDDVVRREDQGPS